MEVIAHWPQWISIVLCYCMMEYYLTENNLSTALYVHILHWTLPHHFWLLMCVDCWVLSALLGGQFTTDTTTSSVVATHEAGLWLERWVFGGGAFIIVITHTDWSPRAQVSPVLLIMLFPDNGNQQNIILILVFSWVEETILWATAACLSTCPVLII